MAAGSEELKKHIKLYWAVFISLAILTVVTVSASNLDVTIGMAVFVAMIIAITKGSLVASIFMHLAFDKNKLVAGLLILCLIFFLALMLVPVLVMSDMLETIDVP